ncbi:MAG: adenylate/guanylate cyclase domain-containing protein [Acidimicrobiia bacterium]|nr:adenylate/guanylate cyclase domain-containing protein [Acidimicrobiia bacterium]
MSSNVRKFLRKRNTPPEEIDRAEEEGWLPVLVIDRLLAPGKREFTIEDVAERAGTDIETLRKLWRALGFPDLPTDVPAFTKDDVEAAKKALSRSDARMGFDEFIDLTRVASVGLNRLAAAETDSFMEALTALREGGADDADVAGALAELIDWDSLADLIAYTHRVLLRAALWRRLARDDAPRSETRELAVGFVDLIGYTALSQELTRDELNDLLDRFEGLSYDIVAEHGGRFVKSIGDEVMFVSTDPVVATDIALSLVAATVADDLIPSARAGVAFGPVLARDGDYYGPIVNLASRLVGAAKRGSVFASEDLQAAVTATPEPEEHDEPEGSVEPPETEETADAGDAHESDEDDSRSEAAGVPDPAESVVNEATSEVPGGERLAWKKLRRRRLSDIGLVPVWEVTRASDAPVDD